MQSPEPVARGALAPPQPRVVVVGDSVISGYGVGGRSYAHMLIQRMGASRSMSYARSTFTVLDAVRFLDRIEKFAPDVVFVNSGGADGLVHAGQAISTLLDRFAPRSWRSNEPKRPSPADRAPSFVRRLRHRITGALQLLVKHVGVRATGGFRRVPPAEFEPAFATLMSRLRDLGCLVVVIGMQTPDEFLWPRSTASGLEYEAATQRVLRDYDDVLFVDPKPVLGRWEDFLEDHLHYNDQGHRKVADLVWEALRHCVHVPAAPPARPPIEEPIDDVDGAR